MIDYKYIRTSAIFKLMKSGVITSKSRALELLEDKHGKNTNIERTLELWIRGNKHWGITND